MANKLKKGDRVLATCVKREMNNCEYAEKSVYYNVDKILKVCEE
jgi:D-arabinose 1-dehydrogenase-like Zn-dependent alcohol dehydrogenase